MFCRCDKSTGSFGGNGGGLFLGVCSCGVVSSCSVVDSSVKSVVGDLDDVGDWSESEGIGVWGVFRTYVTMSSSYSISSIILS